MRKQILILSSLFLAACGGQGQGSNIEVGYGMTGYSSRFVKMDSHAREVALDYLASAYARNCGGKKSKRHVDACKKDKPFLTAGSIPVGAEYHSLPSDVMNRIGSIPPGTDLVQSGYNVYLIHLPDKIIYDNVSLNPYWKESLRK